MHCILRGQSIRLSFINCMLVQRTSCNSLTLSSLAYFAFNDCYSYGDDKKSECFSADIFILFRLLEVYFSSTLLHLCCVDVNDISCEES